MSPVIMGSVLLVSLSPSLSHYWLCEKPAATCAAPRRGPCGEELKPLATNQSGTELTGQDVDKLGGRSFSPRRVLRRL